MLFLCDRDLNPFSRCLNPFSFLCAPLSHPLLPQYPSHNLFFFNFYSSNPCASLFYTLFPSNYFTCVSSSCPFPCFLLTHLSFSYLFLLLQVCRALLSAASRMHFSVGLSLCLLGFALVSLFPQPARGQGKYIHYLSLKECPS